MRDATDAVMTTFLTVGVLLADSKIEVVPLTAGVKRSSLGFASGEATWITWSVPFKASSKAPVVV
jgi:hypothetical protein